jgi:hypothetical protein
MITRSHGYEGDLLSPELGKLESYEIRAWDASHAISAG